MVAIVVAAMVDIVVANLMVAVSSIVMVTTVVRCNLDSVYSSNESCKSEGLVHFVSRLTLICENMS